MSQTVGGITETQTIAEVGVWLLLHRFYSFGN